VRARPLVVRERGCRSGAPTTSVAPASVPVRADSAGQTAEKRRPRRFRGGSRSGVGVGQPPRARRTPRTAKRPCRCARPLVVRSGRCRAPRSRPRRRASGPDLPGHRHGPAPRRPTSLRQRGRPVSEVSEGRARRGSGPIRGRATNTSTRHGPWRTTTSASRSTSVVPRGTPQMPRSVVPRGTPQTPRASAPPTAHGIPAGASAWTTSTATGPTPSSSSLTPVAARGQPRPHRAARGDRAHARATDSPAAPPRRAGKRVQMATALLRAQTDVRGGVVGDGFPRRPGVASHESADPVVHGPSPFDPSPRAVRGERRPPGPSQERPGAPVSPSTRLRARMRLGGGRWARSWRW
jgi:hypothetical protein